MANHTDAEAKQLATMFDQLGFKPKADSTEALVQSLTDWLVGLGKVQVITQEAPPAQPVKQEPGVVDWNKCPPRFSTFSGATPKPASHVDIETWLYDVQCAMDEGAPQLVVMQQIRRSLAEPAKTRLRVNQLKTPKAVVDDFRQHFSPQTSREALLHQFVSAEQTGTEDVRTWGDRLDCLVARLREKGGAHIATDEAVRSRFWRGLYSKDLQAATRVSFDLNLSYQELVSKVRREEEELGASASARKVAKSHQAQASSDGLSQVLQKLDAMDSRLKRLEGGPAAAASAASSTSASQPQAGGKGKKKNSGKCYKCDAPWVKGHKAVCPALNGN